MKRSHPFLTPDEIKEIAQAVADGFEEGMRTPNPELGKAIRKAIGPVPDEETLRKALFG